jgi:hypothetical protein
MRVMLPRLLCDVTVSASICALRMICAVRCGTDPVIWDKVILVLTLASTIYLPLQAPTPSIAYVR